jgi:hypothetical protein
MQTMIRIMLWRWTIMSARAFSAAGTSRER